MRNFLLKIFFSCLALCIFAPGQTLAAVGTITYTNPNTLNFGNITKQTGSDVTSTVASTSSNRGQLNIRDGINNNSETINITFQSCGLTADNVRVKDFTATFGGQSWTVTGDGPLTITGLPNPPNTGPNSQLRYGATIVVTKDAKIGPLTPCYNISIQYDCATITPSCTTAAPAVFNGFANVTVLGAPVIMNDVQQMDFRHITKPTINSLIIMQPNGSMNVSTGDAILLDGSSGSAGIFDVIAEKDTAISISASNGSLSNGLRLINITASFNNSSTQSITTAKTFTTSSTGTNNLKIGATLDVRRTATRGQKSVPYNITIDYQ